MKKTLLASACAVVAAAGAFFAFADVDYSLNLGQNTNLDRKITDLVLSDDAGSPTVTISPIRNSDHPEIYRDLSDQVFQTAPGATVHVKVNGSGEWMHTYAYVDWASDGFNFTSNADYVNTETYALLPGADLVYFNLYVIDDNHFIDSDGNTNFTTSRKEIATEFDFTIPADTPEGEYRMRVKSDWSCLDPKGNSAAGNLIVNNRGTIVDFTLKVVSPIVETVEELVYNTAGEWTISACCQELSGDPGAITNLIDNNPSTFYHSNYTNAMHDGLHYFVLDLGKTQTVSGFAWTPRQTANANNGRWQSYEVFASDDAEAFHFDDVAAGQAWYEANKGQGKSGTLTATANQPAETAKFAEPIKGRYLLFVIPERNGVWSCAAELGLYFQTGLTADDIKARKVAEINAKIDAFKALAEAYKTNAPVCASAVDELINMLGSSTAESLLDYYDIIDEFLAASVKTPLEEIVVDALNTQIGSEVVLYQHGQDAFLSANTKATNKGWDSFNYAATVTPSEAWTLVAGEGKAFTLKSANGQFVGTPIQGYCQTVATEAEAGKFTFGVSNGYVTLKPSALEGCGLGFDGQNDPVEIMTLTDGSKGYEWQVTAYVPVSEENPTYMAFLNKRGNDYLADHAEALQGKYKSSTLYRQTETNTNLVWAVTPGYREGTYRIRNYVTGRYLVELVSYGDVTTESPIDIYLIHTTDGGVSISTDGSTTAQTSIDADNFDSLVGNWVAATDGTTWYTEVIDETKGETMEEAVAYHFGIAKTISNAKKQLEAYRNTVPGSSDLVDEALAQVEALTDESTADADAAAIVAGVVSGIEGLIDGIAENSDVITITNTRRASLNQAALLAYVAGEEEALNVNTIAAATPEALWTIAKTDAGYTFKSVMTGKYIGGEGPALVETAEEATAYALTIRDNGTLNFTTDGTLMNIDTHGNNLTYWSDANDAGSQWVFSAIPVDEQMFGDDEMPIKWSNVISGAPQYPDDSNGNALTEFTITFPAPVKATGLGLIYILDYDSEVTAVVDPSTMAYDEATHTFTGTLDEPITDYYYFAAYATPEAFYCTAEDGTVTYSPELWSNLVLCLYAPDQEADLHVTPEESDNAIAAIETITMWMDGDYFDVNTYCQGNLELSRDFVPMITMTPAEVYDLYNDQTGFFDLPVNTTEDGTYNLTIPAGMFYGQQGRSKKVNMMWDVDKTTGITNVTINGEAAPQRVYDILGRRMKAPVRGLNIVDGVKTLIRK